MVVTCESRIFKCLTFFFLRPGASRASNFWVTAVKMSMSACGSRAYMAGSVVTFSQGSAVSVYQAILESSASGLSCLLLALDLVHHWSLLLFHFLCFSSVRHTCCTYSLLVRPFAMHNRHVVFLLSNV